MGRFGIVGPKQGCIEGPLVLVKKGVPRFNEMARIICMVILPYG